MNQKNDNLSGFISIYNYIHKQKIKKSFNYSIFDEFGGFCYILFPNLQELLVQFEDYSVN
jgi:hypothetical protein